MRLAGWPEQTAPAFAALEHVAHIGREAMTFHFSYLTKSTPNKSLMIVFLLRRRTNQHGE